MRLPGLFRVLALNETGNWDENQERADSSTICCKDRRNLPLHRGFSRFGP